MADDFDVFDVPDTFATGLRVETHPDFVRLIYTRMIGNHRQPMASIILTTPTFDQIVRKFLEVDGLPVN